MDLTIQSLSLINENGIGNDFTHLHLQKGGLIGEDVSKMPHLIRLIDISKIEKANASKQNNIKHPKPLIGNIAVEGLSQLNVNILDRFQLGSLLLEVSKISSPDLSELPAHILDDYSERILTVRVIGEGEIKKGEVLVHNPKIFKVKVITLSDRASKGIYEDRSGALIIEKLNGFFTEIGWEFKIDKKIIPDSREDLLAQIKDATLNEYDLIFTTGGTGIGSRDITVSVVKPLLHQEIPGVMEHIRLKYGSIKPNALLSGGVAGTIETAIIYTLPGSVKAVTEYMQEILVTLKHLVFMKADLDTH